MLEQTIRSAQSRIDWLTANEEKINALGLNVSACCPGTIDFDNPTREQTLAAIKAFGGKWKKEQSGGSTAEAVLLNYETKQDGITIRLYAAPPPPNCRLVEEEIEVPAVPARIEKRMKLVCKEAE